LLSVTGLLLRYALWVRRSMRRLDRDIAAQIDKAYNSGLYPVHKHGLFSVGKRELD
jgi:hypothetical protein